MKEVSKGNSKVTIPATTDEISLATQTLNQVKNDLENYISEKSKTETIMEIAKNIQTSLLPSDLDVFGYEIVAYSKPADDVGGDYYDIIDEKGKKYAVIGDVCGHGLAAGLIMIMAQTLIHSCLQSGITDLTEILIRVNQTLLSNIERLQEDKYMTLTLFRFEENGKIIHSGAHQDILVYRNRTKKVEAIKTYGCWLGILDDISDLVRNNELLLEGDDMMLLFTDGIIEAIDENQNRYEKNRLIKLLEENGEFQPEFVKQKIIESLNDYTIEDDITLMVFKKMSILKETRSM